MSKHTSKYADFFVKINICEKVESLNISNSAAIVFHHIQHQQVLNFNNFKKKIKTK